MDRNGQVQKSIKVAKIKLMIIPQSHAYLQTITKELAKFEIDRYKTYEELHTQGTHRLWSNA